MNQNPPTQDGVKAKFQRAEQRVGKVPFWTKFAQGFSALPGQHKEWAFNTLLLLYYSQVLGMSATLAAVVIAISLVFDAISDPMVGAFSDNFSSRLGRRHPLMLASIAPSCIAIFALFSPPQDLANYYLAAWMLVCTVTLRISFSFFAVPWGAIGAELSTDYKERTIVIALPHADRRARRGAFYILYNWLFFQTPISTQMAFNPDNYSPVCLNHLGINVLVDDFFHIIHNGPNQIFAPTYRRNAEARLSDMVARIHEAIKNQNFKVLFIATLIASAVVIGTGQVFDVYMNAFFWGFGTAKLSWFALSFWHGVSIVTIAPLQKRFEKRDIILIAIIMITVLQMLKVSLRFAGWLPENGDALLLQIFIFHACYGILLLLFLMMFASMMADIADDQELRNGLRQEGIFSGGIAFAGRLQQALG